MPSETKEQAQQQQQPQQPVISDEIRRALEGLRGEVAQTKGERKLLEDPDVLKLLQLKQAGKKVELAEAKDPDDEPDAKEPEDLESLTNREILALAEKRAAKRTRDSVRGQMKELQDQVQLLQGMLHQERLGKYEQQIADARKRYGDFDSYMPVMTVISNQNPGLNIDEVYLLAKRRTAGPTAEQNVQSERPTATAAKPPAKLLVENLPTGRRGNEKLLQAGLSSVLERMKDQLDQAMS